jgi:hypothetical protein
MGHAHIQAGQNILGHVRAWPKTLSDFPLRNPVFLGILERHPTMAAVDPFRPNQIHHMPAGGSCSW